MLAAIFKLRVLFPCFFCICAPLLAAESLSLCERAALKLKPYASSLNKGSSESKQIASALVEAVVEHGKEHLRSSAASNVYERMLSVPGAEFEFHDYGEVYAVQPPTNLNIWNLLSFKQRYDFLAKLAYTTRMGTYEVVDILSLDDSLDTSFQRHSKGPIAPKSAFERWKEEFESLKNRLSRPSTFYDLSVRFNRAQRETRQRLRDGMAEQPEAYAQLRPWGIVPSALISSASLGGPAGCCRNAAMANVLTAYQLGASPHEVHIQHGSFLFRNSHVWHEYRPKRKGLIFFRFDGTPDGGGWESKYIAPHTTPIYSVILPFRRFRSLYQSHLFSYSKANGLTVPDEAEFDRPR